MTTISDDNAKHAQGLTQRLQELQSLMRENYKQHRRRVLSLLVLSATYVCVQLPGYDHAKERL